MEVEEFMGIGEKIKLIFFLRGALCTCRMVKIKLV
jgi:hypothetical protein